MADPSPYEMMTCPYNKAHQIEQFKMHVHLQKCRKSYQECSKVTCPFDATHVYNDAEMDFHITVCPKRMMLDTQMYVVDNDYRPVVEVQGSTSAVECEEDWEASNATTYVPDPAKKGPHIINKVKGLTPSERRQVRMEGVRTYRPQELNE